MKPRILSYSISNYASINEEVSIDFTYNYPNKNSPSKNKLRYISCNDDIKLMPVLGLYGKNGCGKSSILDALSNHFISLGKDKITMKYNPYEFSANPNNETTSKLTFISKNIKYRHTFSYNHKNVLEEKFEDISSNKVIMHIDRRSGKRQETAEIFPSANNDQLSQCEPIMQLYSIDDNKLILNNFVKHFSREYGPGFLPYLHYLRNNAIHTMENLIKTYRVSPILLINKFMQNIQNHFSEIYLENDKIYTKYSIDNKEYYLDITKESDGTMSLIMESIYIMDAITEGRILVIDEIESKIHPYVLKFIISLFTNDKINKNGAVLVYASHNHDTLHYIHHENIHIVEKSYKNHTTSIYKPRDIDGYDEKTFVKETIDGLYGSSPIITESLFISQLMSLYEQSN
jgi:AAA15 family ATPase/GTPase